MSVIIPTFNRAYCLPRAVDSVVAQTHSEWELLIIDDGSMDGTDKLVSGRYGNDPRIRYLLQENRGVSAARNRGLALAQGEYIAFLDSDDMWEPWKLQLQVSCLEHCPEIGMVWTDMKAIDAQGGVVSEKYLRVMYHAYRWFSTQQLFSKSFPLSEFAPDLTHVLNDSRLFIGDIFSQMIMGNLVHTSTVLLTRQRLQEVGRFNEELGVTGEDYDFHLRTCRAGSVGFLDISSIRYQREMPDRLTRDEHRVLIARNFLKTIAPVIEEEKARITLPRKMIDQVLAFAYAWLGEELLNRGDRAAARNHLLKSLQYRGWQPRTWGLLTLASTPDRMSTFLRASYRSLKSFFRVAGLFCFNNLLT